MSTVTLRTVKGSELTWAELDGNFTALNADKLELGASFAAGTANGVAYLNGSKVLTTGAALTFDGTNLVVGGTAVFGKSTILQSLSGTSSALGISDNATTTLYANNVSSGVSALWSSGSLAFGTNNGTFTERMRLTSTGLGIGTTAPSVKLETAGTASGATLELLRLTNSGTGGSTASQLTFYAAGTNYAQITGGYSATAPIVAYNVASGGYQSWQIAAAEQMRLDSSGNLGLGVTPGAWSVIKAIEIGGFRNALFSDNGSTGVGLASGAYFNASWKYALTGTNVGRYEINAGTHIWNTASSGTAGDAITFTQAMTLAAAGNLLVGTTSANANGGVLQLKSGITFPATQVASTDVNTLDDYEEGTWTPTVNFVTNGDLTVVYSNQAARYTKVGNAVHFSARVTTTTFTHTTASGAFRLTGLPFTPSAAQPFVSPSGYITRYTKAGYTQMVFQVASGDSNIYSLLIGSGVAPFSLDPTCLPTAVNFDIVVSGTYFV
jgi:hypothetical protein